MNYDKKPSRTRAHAPAPTLEKKISAAIQLLKAAEAKATAKGGILEISYSGGKDSDVLLDLAKRAGIRYRAIYKCTTIDPPGTIAHVKSKGVEIIRPKETFAHIIQRKGYPTHCRRFCCRILKEYKIEDTAAQGIRKCESRKRKNLYKEPTACRFYNSKKDHVEVFYPVLEWSNKDVEEYVNTNGVVCHPLYYDKSGKFHVERRLGCMGCPQRADKGLAEFKNNPRLVRFWVKNAEIWWNTHPLKRLKLKFADPYELFVRNTFFTSYENFKYAQEGLFGKIDCKKFLVEYFGINL